MINDRLYNRKPVAPVPIALLIQSSDSPGELSDTMHWVPHWEINHVVFGPKFPSFHVILLAESSLTRRLRNSILNILSQWTFNV